MAKDSEGKGDKLKKILVSDEEDSTIFCCCGAKTWTFVIAVLSIIGYTLTLLLGLLFLYNVFDSSFYYATEVSFVNNNFLGSGLGHATVDPLIAIGMVTSGSIGLLLAVVLLLGTFKSKPGLLLIWIFAQSIKIALLLALILVASLSILIHGLKLKESWIFILILSSIASLIIFMFCFSVVRTYRKEVLVECKKNPAIPTHNMFTYEKFENP